MAAAAAAEMDALRQLVQQLQAQAAREHEAELARWAASERPVLRDHAQGMWDTLQVLERDAAALEARVAAAAAGGAPVAAPGAHAGTTTGFNVISSRRTDAEGRPLSVAALEAEAARLRAAAAAVELDALAAKAEITAAGRRAEERDIWETKLVALLDTKRVLRDEVNLLEVEALGRRHAERAAAERARADASGAAALQRLREQAAAARQRYNRAKTRFYFPEGRGYNIWFGGGGIFGACKDIVISEIDGAARVRTQPGPLGPDGRPASVKLIVEFQGPSGGGGGGKGGAAPAGSPAPAADAAVRRSASERAPAAAAGTPRRAATFPHPARPGSGQGQQQQQQPAAAAAATPRGQGAMALRFMARIRSKKDRYNPAAAAAPSGGGGGAPAPEGGAKPRRSLASKLLTRSSAARGPDAAAPAPRGSLGSDMERLAFGGHALGEGRASSAAGGAAGAGGDEFEDRTEETGSDAGRLSQSDAAGLDPLCDDDDAPAPAGAEAGGGAAAAAAAGERLARLDVRGDDDWTPPPASPLTSDNLRAADAGGGGAGAGAAGGGASARGSWLHDSFSGGGGASGAGAAWLAEDAAPSSAGSWADGDAGGGVFDAVAAAAAPAPPPGAAGAVPPGVFVFGRLKGFDLVGERGTRVPNLTIGAADVRATVFCRFVFEFSPARGGWGRSPHEADRPVFHVDKLAYRLTGNNVPMPAPLIKHILRAAIPGIIQRRLLALLPRELGSYLLAAGGAGLDAAADVAVVGPSPATLDADLAFEVRGPARTPKEARKQASRYAAAKEARSLLGLSLPQAQLLAQLFGGPGALLAPPRRASITELIALQASLDRAPALYARICRALGSAYRRLAQAAARADGGAGAGAGARRDRGDPLALDFAAFMEGPVAALRRKPARARVVARALDAALDVDAATTALHDYTQRAIEEVWALRGPGGGDRAARGGAPAAPALVSATTAPLPPERRPPAPAPAAPSSPGGAPAPPSADEELEVLHAWHAWALRELSHFKERFHGAGATLLAAADARGLSAGAEAAHYEGPLRLRLPVASSHADADGALSFDVPLPSPAGRLGVFVDAFKELTVPAHLRPPAGAVNWVKLSGDPAADARMVAQVSRALELIAEVLDELEAAVARAAVAGGGAPGGLEDAATAFVRPRTGVGDRLGRLIVSRLRVRARLDERRVGELLAGLGPGSLGADFVPTAARIVGHLGDVLSMGYAPAADLVDGHLAAGGDGGAYVFQLETSDVSRVRADVASLGFRSAVPPAAAVRLVHALVRAARLAFGPEPADAAAAEAELEAYRDRMAALYRLVSRDALGASACLDVRAGVEGGRLLVCASGAADDAAGLRATAPLVLTNEVDLVALGRAMRGDPPAPPRPPLAPAGAA